MSTIGVKLFFFLFHNQTKSCGNEIDFFQVLLPHQPLQELFHFVLLMCQKALRRNPFF